MNDFRRYGFALLGIALLVGAVAARGQFGDTYSVRPTELVLLVLPFLMWLLASGEIQSLKVGATGLEVKSAVQRAARSPIAAQIENLPFQQLVIDEKGGVSDLDRIASSRPQALSFTKHEDDWHSVDAARQYIQRLSVTEGFKYFLFLGKQRFIGAIATADLARALGLMFDQNQQPAPLMTVDTFVRILNSKIPDDALRQLPGFVDQAVALTRTTDKKTALAKMEEAGLAWLPVIDSRSKRLMGIVEQSRIATSLILDLTRALEDPQRGRGRA